MTCLQAVKVVGLNLNDVPQMEEFTKDIDHKIWKYMTCLEVLMLKYTRKKFGKF